MVTVESNLTQLAGGLDLATMPTLIKPGFALDALNYEIDSINGGYSRINGYERFDGRPSPTAASYWLLSFSGTAPSVGATITGGTSGATGKVLSVVGQTLVLGRVSGTFVSGEAIGAATTTSVATESGEPDVATHAQYKKLAAADRRADIQAVPGSGPVLGVWIYKDTIYAFRNNAGGTAAVMHKATASGWSAVTTPALAPSGRYEFVNHNFTGSTDTLKMYGCDGKNRAFQFDGTTFTQITTGMATDTPSHIAVHNNYLFLSFNGSLQNSPIGNPTGAWTLTTGTTEIGVGDTITALLPQPGDATTSALHVFSTGSTHTLYGKTSADWRMVIDSPTTGAAQGTAQWLGAAFVLAARGIQHINTTMSFGDFQFATVSGLVQPMINRLTGTAVSSAAFKSRNQYRIFYSDGTALAMTIMGNKPVGIMPMLYTHPVTCYTAQNLSSGAEVCYFGSTDGYVYQDNTGTSFDGGEIASFLRLPFNHLGSPRYRKRFRRLILDMLASEYTTLNVAYELGASNNNVSPGITQAYTSIGNGGYWNSFYWNQFVWGAQPVDQPSLDLTGTEKNISILFHSSTDVCASHTIQGVTLNYTVRRLER